MMHYIITGIDRKGRRFKKITPNLAYAYGHNVYRGTLWEVRDGKRKRLHRWH